MKILYYYSKLNIGGAERSTVRLLNKMVEMEHDITLLLRWNNGTLENELDSRVNVIYLKKGDSDNTGLFLQFIEICKMRIRLRLIKKNKYDLVINGLFGYNPSILFKYVNAKKYFQMLRNDVSKTGMYGKTVAYMKKYGSKFDAYIGVSKFTTDSFKKCYPQLKDKAFTVYNILPEVDPKEENVCPEELSKNEKYIKILTVCRMDDKAKGLFRMEKVCKQLQTSYPSKFKWFVVGEGPDKEKLQKQIEKDGLSQCMILCPGTRNPFPYYAHSDLVAVLSYYEGLCGVVNEAKMMCRPLIATEFSGIHEQIKNGINGMIVDNNENAILEGLHKILNNPSCLKNMAVNGMSKKLLDNDEKINELCQIYNI